MCNRQQNNGKTSHSIWTTAWHLGTACEGDHVAWSGHSETGSAQGVLVKRTAAKVEDDETWERAMQWAMVTSASKILTFWADILGVEDSEVVSWLCSALLHNNHANHSGCEQQTVLAASRRTELC